MIPIAASASKMGHSLGVHLSYKRVEGDRDQLVSMVQEVKKSSKYREN
jgi:hypothetical protein